LFPNIGPSRPATYQCVGTEDSPVVCVRVALAAQCVCGLVPASAIYVLALPRPVFLCPCLSRFLCLLACNSDDGLRHLSLAGDRPLVPTAKQRYHNSRAGGSQRG
jgi:hypothetical protein